MAWMNKVYSTMLRDPGTVRESTSKAFSQKLLSFWKKWSVHFTVKGTETHFPPTTQKTTKKTLTLFFLRMLPFLCLGGFLVSLSWDFSGTILFPWRNYPIETDGLLRKLMVTGLIGFLTNWIAIKMLFYPRQKRPLLNQGLIPAHREKIAIRLGEQISKEIINSKLILEKVASSGLLQKYRMQFSNHLQELVKNTEFQKDLFSLLQHCIDQYLHSPAFQKVVTTLVHRLDFDNLEYWEKPLLHFYRLLLSEKKINQKLSTLLNNINFRVEHYEGDLNEYLAKIPSHIREKGESLDAGILSVIVFFVEHINVQEVIFDNLKKFDDLRLEQVLWRSTSNQFLYIQYLGCLLGIVGGFFVWLPLESSLALTLFAGFFGGLDWLIFHYRSSRPKF